jgi:hypothetical protein
MQKRNGNETFAFADDSAPKTHPQQPDHAQKMLDFILRWPRESIATTDLMTYGPKPRQNAEETFKLATLLERQGWLTKKSMPRKDQHHWTINRKPFVHPKIDHSPAA